MDRVLIGDNLRKSAVKYLLFFRRPVVRGPAFAAYCRLPTAYCLSRPALSAMRHALCFFTLASFCSIQIREPSVGLVRPGTTSELEEIDKIVILLRKSFPKNDERIIRSQMPSDQFSGLG